MKNIQRISDQWRIALGVTWVLYVNTLLRLLKETWKSQVRSCKCWSFPTQGLKTQAPEARSPQVSHLLGGASSGQSPGTASRIRFCVHTWGSPLLSVHASLTPLKIYWAGPPHLMGLGWGFLRSQGPPWKLVSIEMLLLRPCYPITASSDVATSVFLHQTKKQPQISVWTQII